MKILKHLKELGNWNQRTDCCWLVHHCRTTSMSCGVCWTSCCQRSSPLQTTSTNGLILEVKPTRASLIRRKNSRTTKSSKNFTRFWGHSCSEESRGRSRSLCCQRSRCISRLVSRRPRNQSTVSCWRNRPLRKAAQPVTIRTFLSNWERFVITLICSQVSNQKTHQPWATISSKLVVKCNSWKSYLKRQEQMIVRRSFSQVSQPCLTSSRTTAGSWSTRTVGSTVTPT